MDERRLGFWTHFRGPSTHKFGIEAEFIEDGLEVMKGQRLLGKFHINNVVVRIDLVAEAE